MREAAAVASLSVVVRGDTRRRFVGAARCAVSSMLAVFAPAGLRFGRGLPTVGVDARGPSPLTVGRRPPLPLARLTGLSSLPSLVADLSCGAARSKTAAVTP